MKAEAINVRGDTAFIVLKSDDPHLYAGDGVIQINSIFADSLAAGIVRMITVEHCPECGRFGGLHGEVFTKTGQDNGEVRGTFGPCPRAPK